MLKTRNSINSAMVGVKSNMPIRGMIFRRGRRIRFGQLVDHCYKTGLNLLAVGNQDKYCPSEYGNDEDDDEILENSYDDQGFISFFGPEFYRLPVGGEDSVAYRCSKAALFQS